MQTEFRILHSRVIENGIMFYSNSNEDYAAISTIDKNGNIKAEWTSVQKYRKEHKKEQIIVDFKNFLLFLPLIIFLVIPFVILLFSGAFTSRYAIKNLLQFALICNLVIILTVLLYRPKNMLKLKAASDMLVNAYRELRSPPSLEELSTYSYLDNFSGSNSLMLTAIIDILLLFCTCINNPFIAIIVSLIVVVLIKPKLEILSYTYGFLNFSQAFSKTSPTDTELMVAISALEVWIKNEGYK
ncbi:MAG: hypothetical protein HFJ19_02365 [Clostridia bacterium]|nr:hypothetical protein [Clostridia bacterium]